MTETITISDAQYAYDIVKRICDEVGPGSPGSRQERERAAIIREELEAHLGAANVTTEEFRLAPGALLGAQRLSALFMLIAALLNISTGRLAGVPSWVTALVAVGFSILSVLVYVLQFVFTFEFVDPLFRRGSSVNVVGALRQPATKDVKRLLIVSGHHDSALENIWLRYLGYGFLVFSGIHFIAMVTTLIMSLVQLTGVIMGSAGVVRGGTMGWVVLPLLILPSVVYALCFSLSSRNGGTVPGAADNLAASALTVALCRFLVQNPSYIPDDTEIRFISFGSEEAGLRGSRRYVERHLEELQRLDARLLNFETIAHPEIGILRSDVNGVVKHSSEMVRAVSAAAERAGVPHRVRSAHLGVGTDAGPFSRAGLEATSLLAFDVPRQMVAFYHQKWDTPEVLTIEPLMHVLSLTLEWVRSGGA